ncbi:MAG TPA: S8 family serine peptidase [Pyrinomonadaceae bacterium]|jgi:serine protease AprX
MEPTFPKTRRITAILLVCLLAAIPATAGIVVTGADGIVATGADGITYINTTGIVATGADNFLAFTTNGIVATGADGIVATGADGVTFTGTNGIVATGADGTQITRANGIVATGANGIVVTGADGTPRHVDSVSIRKADGIVVTGADGVTATGANGIVATGADGREIAHADGIVATGADGITINAADGIVATGADGTTFNISPSGISITGADCLNATGADGISITGANGIVATGADTIAPIHVQTGLRSVDPELAILLNRVTDDSNVNAVVVYHRLPDATDIADLQRIGVTGGTRYYSLPMITLTARRRQIFEISHLPNVRSIYGNRTLQAMMDSSLSMTRAEQVRGDGELRNATTGLPLMGSDVTVAVLDTGLDGTHPDLSGRVVQNVKLADAQSASAGFGYPLNIENVPNTDQAYGHGTFVAGLVGGSGNRSGSKYGGVAPGVRLVGLSAGDLNLSYVLAGFDYLLLRGAGLNVRVVNCSFSANTVFDVNDPVNVATKMLVDSGINVVFSAGNTGDGLHTLNPYAVAPWVISVGATDDKGELASFSSRGDFGHPLFRPTLVAPGVNVISLRAASAYVTGTLGVAGADLSRLSATELPFYTTASGTSFSAPQVAGAIALMLEANPQLKPAEVKDILQRTATPLISYYQHEVGAGMLNTHAAVLEAAYPARRMGDFRAVLDLGQVKFTNEPEQRFGGTAQPGDSSNATLNVPTNTVLASVQTAWSLSSTNDLGLSVYDANGILLDDSNTKSRPGLTGMRERVLIRNPAAGALTARVLNTPGTISQLLASAQGFKGLLEVTRVQYPLLDDTGGLSSVQRAEVGKVLRTFMMRAYGRNFRPSFGVSRIELAAALMMSGHVPQYLPSQSRFTDVKDRSSMLFVESAQSMQGAPLFYDATFGGEFLPEKRVDRLTAAVALVRAAGLRAEADSQSGATLAYTDTASIPSALRGYVAVAISRGLLTAEGGAFRPDSQLTRLELAHALCVISNL